MLIIEGADLTGKTTLAKRLAKLLNEQYGLPHVYQHLSRLPACWRGRARELHEELARRWVVQDRFHMSEVAYASARKDEPMLSPVEYELLDCSLRAGLGALTVVLVDLTGDVIRSRWRDGEMFTLGQVLKVNDYYKDIIRDEVPQRRMRHDWAVPAGDIEDWAVQEIARQYAERQAIL